MKPALDTLAQALETIRLEKWKTSGAIREEMDGNIASIRRDVGTTLPPLLANADAAPESVAQALPAFRNIEALYDVLLRVSAAGRLAAPAPQSAALDHATASLDAARRAFGDQMQSAAIAQERQVSALKAAALRAVPPPVAAPVATPPAPSTRTQKKPVAPRRKTAPKASAPE